MVIFTKLKSVRFYETISVTVTANHAVAASCMTRLKRLVWMMISRTSRCDAVGIIRACTQHCRLCQCLPKSLSQRQAWALWWPKTHVHKLSLRNKKKSKNAYTNSPSKNLSEAQFHSWSYQKHMASRWIKKPTYPGRISKAAPIVSEHWQYQHLRMDRMESVLPRRPYSSWQGVVYDSKLRRN